jgi:predicted ATPase
VLDLARRRQHGGLQTPVEMTPAPESVAVTEPVTAWTVRLLGDVVLDNGQRTLTKLPTHAATALLARLALAPGRAHAREELVELLWPGVDLAVGRNRMRHVLSTLKAVLEDGGQAPAIVADRMSLRVVPGRLACDALQFEAACRAGDAVRARALYRGDLMPGFFDEWIAEERLRLQALLDRLPSAEPPSRLPQLSSIGAAPAYLTRFFGRQAESARLRAEVMQHRLVTLLGPGGAGKTRLAAELTTALREAPPLQAREAGTGSRFDRVLFVPLVTSAGHAEVLHALAAALATEASLAALERALVGQHTLLVLDNFEHLVEAAADIAQALLTRLPRLHLLVTSRRVLGIDGERECQLGTLPLPPANSTLAEATANPAVALFIDRARAVHDGFQLDADNLGDVLRLVRYLDGIPLALELAAARCRSLSAAAMLQAIQAEPDASGWGTATPMLDLLERQGSRGDRDGRHASMGTVLQWSWQLLDRQAQDLLAGLTVFQGGCTAEAVAQVCGLSLSQAAHRLDQLASQSLIQVLRGRGASQDRFQLLELIREFASARLDAPRALALRTRLRRWLTDWARVEGRLPLPWRIEPELPNVHAALIGACSDGAQREAMELALGLRDYWELDGMPPLSQQALQAALDERGSDWPTALRCDAHELLAYTGIGAGDGPLALVHADAALALAGSDALRRGRCLLRRVWVNLAIDYCAPGQFEPLDEALALALQAGDIPLQARTLHQQGILARYQGNDFARADGLFAEAQALWTALGNRRLAHARLRNRAQCWAAQGLHAQALASFRQCEEAARAEGDWVGIIDSTLGASTELTCLRQWGQAVAMGSECIRVAWLRHHAHGLAYALWNIAYPLLRAGRTDDAVRLRSLASSYWTLHMGPLRADDQRDTLKLRRLAGLRIAAGRIDSLWREGAELTVSEAVAIALRH